MKKSLKSLVVSILGTIIAGLALQYLTPIHILDILLNSVKYVHYILVSTSINIITIIFIVTIVILVFIIVVYFKSRYGNNFKYIVHGTDSWGFDLKWRYNKKTGVVDELPYCSKDDCGKQYIVNYLPSNYEEYAGMPVYHCPICGSYKKKCIDRKQVENFHDAVTSIVGKRIGKY